jgi:hypothetical protein
MDQLMSFQSTPLDKGFITHIKVMLSISMNDFMMLKIMLKGKDFVTNITSKWTHLNHRNKRFLAHISADTHDCGSAKDASSDPSDH